MNQKQGMEIEELHRRLVAIGRIVEDSDIYGSALADEIFAQIPMILHVLKHPSPDNLATCIHASNTDTVPAGYEVMTREEFLAWKSAEIAGGWVPVPDPAPGPAPDLPRKQSARTVLSRLTTDEKAALRACTEPAIRDAYDVALIEGTISEADPDFSAFVGGCDALGIIAASRWAALLAP